MKLEILVREERVRVEIKAISTIRDSFFSVFKNNNIAKHKMGILVNKILGVRNIVRKQ